MRGRRARARVTRLTCAIGALASGGDDDDVGGGGGQRLKIEGRGILENVNGAAGLDLVQLTMKFTKDPRRNKGAYARRRAPEKSERARKKERERTRGEERPTLK